MTQNATHIKKQKGYNIRKHESNNKQIETIIYGKLTLTKNGEGIQSITLVSERSD